VSAPDERRPKPPTTARVSELEIGGETLLVISFPIDEPGLTEPLTEAEREVARLAVDGLSNAAIAKQRGTSMRTVANQMASILRKLGVESRRELATRWHRRT
jgi:DNA-binding NarL/FixJ family response regulator